MIEVELPDGSVAEFPDGTAPDAIKGALRKRFPTQAAEGKTDLQPMPPSAPAGPSTAQQMADLAQGVTPLGIAKNVGSAIMDPMQALQKADDGVRMLANGASFGFADKLAGYMNGTGTEAERERSGQAKERLGPVTSSGLEIAGSMAPVGALMKAGVTATAIPKVPQFIGSVMDGSALGALSAYGNDTDVLTGAGFGALGGAAGDVVGKIGNKVMTQVAERGKIPNLEQITKKADDLYKGADAEGVMFSNDAAKTMLGDVQNEFAKKSFEPILEPGADRVLKVLTQRIEAGNPMSAEGLKAIKSATNSQFIPGNDRNTMLLKILKGKVDDFTSNPSGAIAGDAQKAASMRKEADALWSQKKKIEAVRKALEKGENRAARTGSGGNTENAVKQELAKIIDDPRKGRGFTPDERAMVEDVVYNQTGRDILRTVGKLSPFHHGGVAALGGLGLLAEPITASVGLGAGTASKLIGNAIQKSKAKQIEKLIAVGGNKARLPKPSQSQKAILDAITRSLMIGGATVPQG